jgi:tRNA(His) 5'-end guanylyltransferase
MTDTNAALMPVDGDRMKAKEVYSSMKAVPPVMVRFDGRGFSRLTDDLKFDKPYDALMQRIMNDAVTAFMKYSGFAPTLAYTFSDEISVLFAKELPFDGRIEKITSDGASYIASAFVLAVNEVFNNKAFVLKPKDNKPAFIPSFDARVVPLHPDEVAEYLVWRQAECYRNFVQGYGFYTIMKNLGLTNTAAQRKMNDWTVADINEFCFGQGINLNNQPAWQRRGTLMFFEKYMKDGYNPVTKETVKAERMRLNSMDAPQFSSPEGRQFVKELTVYGSI